ncbi:hypothetical protein A4R26_13680 [Niastella populi]|uniref:Uncharacterized protein n=1 Tax=Niastella populi TaxID=550983 RepID=A0A1V9G6N0_9BACT|nr:hypothetical protein A4R26_13680 [Niastella populi]
MFPVIIPNLVKPLRYNQFHSRQKGLAKHLRYLTKPVSLLKTVFIRYQKKFVLFKLVTGSLAHYYVLIPDYVF